MPTIRLLLLIPGHLEIPSSLLDRLALDEVLASNPRNRLHDQHPLTTRFESKRVACNGLTSGGALPHRECY
jgi:hypothetical protein